MTAALESTFDAAALAGTVLVMPTVSIGNVPQLATDLLICSVGSFVRLGCLGTPFVLDCCGPDAFGGKNNLAMPLEVYLSRERNMTVLQQRAPVIEGFLNEFCDALCSWIQSANFSGVLLLASADAAYRPDSLIHGTPVFYRIGTYMANQFGDLVAPLLHDISDHRLKGSSTLSHMYRAAKRAGLSKRFCCFVIFTMEGDNMQDTLISWSILASALDLPAEPRMPLSWSNLYGAIPSGAQCGKDY